MYAIYAYIGVVLGVNVGIYSIHGVYEKCFLFASWLVVSGKDMWSCGRSLYQLRLKFQLTRVPKKPHTTEGYQQ